VDTRGRHLGRRVWWTRWWALGGAVVLVVGGSLVGLAAASSGSTHSASGSDPRPPAGANNSTARSATAITQAQAQLAAAVTVSPASGTTGVALNDPVSVSTATGKLLSVQVVPAAGGTPLTGTLAATGAAWSSAAPLQPTSTYRVVATVARPDGLTAQREASFTTLTPTYLVGATAYPSDGMTVGVGQPIVINFDHYVRTAAGQAAALSHISVSMSKPVPGGWYWFSMDELHFRPETYWPAGEKVTVTANLDGWNAGLGRWGHGRITDTFSIGDARISIANLATDEMQVTLNGATVATYPISGGRQQYPTMNGTHIVLDRESVVHMVSSTVGIPVNSPNGYDEFVYDDVHISDSGEYVHSAPWSVGSQGITNVSHGCINMSPDNALTFFNFSRVGDVIEVVGGPRPPVGGDHGVMDWSNIPWSQWTAAAVHSLA
jgi:lipoprotein-anchoring transpeptidase ErfK/SrfK